MPARTDASRFDLASLLAALVLVGIGLAMFASIGDGAGASPLAGRQAAAAGIGLLLFFAVIAVDYRTLAAFALPPYLAGLLLLVLVLLVGRSIANAQSWIELGPLRLQPSEPMKPLTALMLAAAMGERGPTTARFLDYARMGLVVGVPIALILLEPDMGTALTYVPMLLAAAFLAGMRVRTIVILVVVACLAVPLFWVFVLKDYQKERILTVLDPSRDPSGIGYQVKQSRIAIGSGGATGRGFGEGSQSRLKFLPQQHTDFIFAFLAEERGFVGAGAVLGLLAFLVFRCLQTARLARDRLGLHLAALIGVSLGGQIIVNVGMVLGFLPTIGVPLPLVSYGGSSVMATMLSLGLVANVRVRRFVN